MLGPLDPDTGKNFEGNMDRSSLQGYMVNYLFNTIRKESNNFTKEEQDHFSRCNRDAALISFTGLGTYTAYFAYKMSKPSYNKNKLSPLALAGQIFMVYLLSETISRIRMVECHTSFLLNKDYPAANRMRHYISERMPEGEPASFMAMWEIQNPGVPFAGELSLPLPSQYSQTEKSSSTMDMDVSSYEQVKKVQNVKKESVSGKKHELPDYNKNSYPRYLTPKEKFLERKRIREEQEARQTRVPKPIPKKVNQYGDEIYDEEEF